ncbi:hypothetical protein F8388_021374 [Cannabis sativa]|uniref:Uncharacterized protein n=1 Tax=Cannabis sativa TaxID=3483 RepID=A0A7J6FDJ0_CANSA|nr:hypothetical protein F8388_021374 [Cannabis sativa]
MLSSNTTGLRKSHQWRNPTFPDKKPSISNTVNAKLKQKPSSIASTRAAIPPSSTIASFPSSTAAKLLKTTIAFSANPVPCSATSSTNGFTTPALTALSLFCFTEQSLYSVVSASFFPLVEPLSKSETRGGIAPQAPIEVLFSSTRARLSRAHAAFCFEVSVPVLRT